MAFFLYLSLMGVIGVGTFCISARPLSLDISFCSVNQLLQRRTSESSGIPCCHPSISCLFLFCLRPSRLSGSSENNPGRGAVNVFPDKLSSAPSMEGSSIR